MNRKVVAAVIAAVLIVGGAYFASPFWAAREFKNAAVSGNVDDLNGAVDFSAVRESLKGQLAAAMATKMQSDPAMRNNPFAGLGTMMMPAIIDKMVDTFVTADAIAAAVKQGKLEHGGSKEAGPNATYHYAYRGLDHFAVTALAKGDQPDQAPAFVFERRGLFSWKLIRLEIPPKAFAK